jgi:hypothetical protein
VKNSLTEQSVSRSYLQKTRNDDEKNKIWKLEALSRLLGFWTMSIVRYSKNTEEHNVSETGSVSVFR